MPASTSTLRRPASASAARFWPSSDTVRAPLREAASVATVRAISTSAPAMPSTPSIQWKKNSTPM